ncbi:MAG: DUF5689 domain-containing protein [Chitinophagales bacterium]|jgi:hypothetical protein|nr:DUF5689 domain-containing protein [Chitinophagales bacterium]
MKKLFLLFAVLPLLTFTSCFKENFDEPAEPTDPNLPVNFTIKQLKDWYVASGSELATITQDLTISGVVTADDKSGNFYKEMVIQDATGAIGIKINLSDFYTKYPIGRKVYVKLKGLNMGKYRDLIQLGGNIDSTSNPNSRELTYISASQANQAIIGGKLGELVNDTILTVEQINRLNRDIHMQYRKVIVRDVEFRCADLRFTYADAVNKIDQNRILKSVTDSLIVRTSAYSDFAATSVNPNRGEVAGILTVFGSTIQLKLRSVGDVNFKSVRNDKRCTGGPIVYQSVSIKDVRDLLGTSTSVSLSGLKFTGTVISDRVNQNVSSSRVVVIQDNTAGINFFLTANHSLNLNDLVEVTIDQATLKVFNNQVEISDLDPTKIVKIGTGNITPRVATIAEVLNNFSAWQSTLVTVKDAKLTSTATNYFGVSGRLNLTDASSNMQHITYSQATFRNTDFPTSTISMTGILLQNNADRLIAIRNLSDVVASSGGGGGGGGGSTQTLTTLGAVRTAFASGTRSFPNQYVEATVISDNTFAAFPTLNIVVQDNTGGIIVRFVANTTIPFVEGDKLKIDISALTIEEFNGALQLNNVPLSAVTKLAGGQFVTPTVLTIANLNANFERYESTLVEILSVGILPDPVKLNPTYAELKYAKDNLTNAEIGVFVRSLATFASDIYSGVIANKVIGVVSEANNVTAPSRTKSITIRKKADIQ